MTKMKPKLLMLLSVTLGAALAALAQSPEFNEPWTNPNVAIAIDPFVKNEIDCDLLALDLESPDATRHMSFDEARAFIKRIKAKTGRYPLIYANNLVTKAISEQYGADKDFAKTHLWYARFKQKVTDFPEGTWQTYTLWQFSSELNCDAANRPACLYTVPGTEYDMDVDVYNGTIEELKSKWPFDQRQPSASRTRHLSHNSIIAK